MKRIAAFFKLIRWKNLLILFSTLLFLWWVLIDRVAAVTGMVPFLTFEYFGALAISTLCIMAAGNIINDYLDVKIDLRNKPERVVIGTIISKRWAIALHSLLNIIGIAIAGYIGEKVGNPYLIGMQISCTLLLWVYSTHFKRMYVVGNFIVACLTGFAVLLLLFYEPMLIGFLQSPVFLHQNQHLKLNPAYVIVVYSFFAFMLTWMREIVKDMEDFKGDKEEGCMTMPIKIGLLRTARFFSILGVTTALPLVYVVYELLQHKMWVIASIMLLFIVVPILLLAFNIHKKATQSHYANWSRYLKIIMLLGIFTILLITLI